MIKKKWRKSRIGLGWTKGSSGVVVTKPIPSYNIREWGTHTFKKADRKSKHKYFKTKPQAVKFAKAYMKKH